MNMGDKSVAPVPLIDFHLWKDWLESRMKAEKIKSTVADLAEKSVDKESIIVTETLAKITAKQGDLDKALWMYQQLILKNPEKSDYFAQEIEKLKV
jgi:hypothetical protein